MTAQWVSILSPPKCVIDHSYHFYPEERKTKYSDLFEKFSSLFLTRQREKSPTSRNRSVSLFKRAFLFLEKSPVTHPMTRLSHDEHFSQIRTNMPHGFYESKMEEKSIISVPPFSPRRCDSKVFTCISQESHYLTCFYSLTNVGVLFERLVYRLWRHKKWQLCEALISIQYPSEKKKTETK